jgi:hypothetical protein
VIRQLCYTIRIFQDISAFLSKMIRFWFILRLRIIPLQDWLRVEEQQALKRLGEQQVEPAETKDLKNKTSSPFLFKTN